MLRQVRDVHFWCLLPGGALSFIEHRAPAVCQREKPGLCAPAAVMRHDMDRTKLGGIQRELAQITVRGMDKAEEGNDSCDDCHIREDADYDCHVGYPRKTCEALPCSCRTS